MAAQLSQQNFPISPDQVLLQFLTILPDSEYEVEKRTCSTGQRLDRDQVLLKSRTRYDNLQRWQNKEGGRRDAGHAFIADAGSSGKPGGQSTSRGTRNRGVWAEVGAGAGAETEEKKVAKRRMAKRRTSMPATETSTARKEATQGAAVVVRPATNRCDAPDRCVSVCGGKGHSAKNCANVVTVFACEADASGSDSNGVLSGGEQDTFVCDAPGKFSDEPGKWGTNALVWQMGDVPVICDNGASCRMSHSFTGMINYRKANATMRTASDKRYPIEGHGDLPLTFRSSSGEVPLLLCNVAHVPSLSYHLLSLRVAADNGHTYTGNKKRCYSKV